MTSDELREYVEGLMVGSRAAWPVFERPPPVLLDGCVAQTHDIAAALRAVESGIAKDAETSERLLRIAAQIGVKLLDVDREGFNETFVIVIQNAAAEFLGRKGA